MKVSEYMQSGPVTVAPDTLVSDIAKLMTNGGPPHVVVVEAGGAVAGVITAADLIAKHAKPHFPTYFSLLGFSFPVASRHGEEEIQKALATTAADLMSSNLVVITPDADVDDAATLMMDNEVSIIPVVASEKLVGTIDELDIVRLLVVEESA